MDTEPRKPGLEKLALTDGDRRKLSTVFATFSTFLGPNMVWNVRPELVPTGKTPTENHHGEFMFTATKVFAVGIAISLVTKILNTEICSEDLKLRITELEKNVQVPLFNNHKDRYTQDDMDYIYKLINDMLSLLSDPQLGLNTDPTTSTQNSAV